MNTKLNDFSLYSKYYLQLGCKSIKTKEAQSHTCKVAVSNFDMNVENADLIPTESITKIEKIFYYFSLLQMLSSN